MINLKYLNLNENFLQEIIPSTLGLMARLESVFLWNCELTGPIPSEIGFLQDLTFLNIGSNNLTSTLPSELGFLTKLSKFMHVRVYHCVIS